MAERDVPLPAALRQAAALWRARGEHTERLLDVSSLASGEVRLDVEDGGTPLSEVLARGPTLGESVTVLVPLAEGIEDFLAAGVAHGAIGVGAVRVDARGAPVLGGFGEARLDEPSAAAADRAAFRELARIVVEAAQPGGEVAPSLAAVAAIEPGEAGSLRVFAARLLALVQPAPVWLGPPKAAERVDGAPPGLAPGRMQPLARSPALRERLEAVRARLGAVRPRFWAPAVAAAVALVAALVLVPGDEPPQDGPDVEVRAAGPSGAPAPIAAASPGPSAAADRGPDPPADPVRAVLALRSDAIGATVVDDYGDVVLLALETRDGREDVLIERTDAGWRLRDTAPVEEG